MLPGNGVEITLREATATTEAPTEFTLMGLIVTVLNTPKVTVTYFDKDGKKVDVYDKDGEQVKVEVGINLTPS